MNRRQFLIGGGGLAALVLGAGAYSIRQSRTMSAYTSAADASRAPLGEQPALEDLVRFAALAANGHNTQPWLFRLGANRIAIEPDFTRRTPAVDPDDHHLFVSIGCAAENLAIAAAARGLIGDPVLREDKGIAFEFSPGPRVESRLLEAIPRRQSTRAEYDGRQVGPNDLAVLEAAARKPGVELVLITERQEIDRVSELVVAGNSAQMADAAFVRELKDWIRFSAPQAVATGDGLFAAASGNPILPQWLGRPLFDLVFQAKAENEKYVRHIKSSAGIAIFVSEQDDKDHWMKAGRACQRFALQATALGLKLAFINQPVEVPEMRRQFAAHFGFGNRRPDLVMRFGYGPDLPRSLRRPVEAVVRRA